MSYLIPGGRNKGQPIDEAQLSDLQYWERLIGGNLRENKSRHPDKDKPLLAALQGEIKYRNGGGAAKKSEAALATIEEAKKITGSFRDVGDVTTHLQTAAEKYHLVSPATSCPRLPEGCSVAFNAISISPDTECFEVAGGKDKKFSPGKSALQKISVAAGIDWDSKQSGRLDDGSDPYYCNWQAVGWLPQFDCTVRRLVACKEMDLREGSAQINMLWERYHANVKKWESNGKKDREPKSPEAQIREMRLHIQAHAETKAQLRATRAAGIKSAYTRDELAKPFVIARIMFTGESDDPELRKVFAEKTADTFLGGQRALYGDGPTAPPQPSPPVLPKSPPPPVSRPDEPYDVDAEIPEDERY